MMKLFLVGCPRSGTTMLQQALNRHSRILIPPETALFFSVLGRPLQAQQRHILRLNADLGIDLPIPHKRLAGVSTTHTLFEELAARYVRRMGKTGLAYFGEKSPEHLRRLPYILEAYPDAKIVVLYRDGRDVALSLTKVPWMHTDLNVNFAVWLYYCRLQHWWQRRGLENICCVRYEDLVTRPEVELRKVLAFLGLPYEADVTEGYGNGDGIPSWEYAWKGRALEPITAARIGIWKQEIPEEQVERLERWGSRTLTSLGYKLSCNCPRPLPPWFFPKLCRDIVVWRLKRTIQERSRNVTPNGVD
jgi:hypothetical protein